MSIAALKDRIKHVKATVAPEILNAKDTVKSKFFTEPGIYEVESFGIIEKPKKAGGTFSALCFKGTGGQEDFVFPRIMNKEEKPDPFYIQTYLKGFGMCFSQAHINLIMDDLLPLLPGLLVGKVMAKLSFYGYVPDYIETGKYGIRDFSRGAKPYPDNWVVDPINGEPSFHQSREAAEAYMAEVKMKKGGKQWDFLRPAEGFEFTPAQKEVVEAMEELVEEKKKEEIAQAAEAAAAPPPVESKPAKPASMAKK